MYFLNNSELIIKNEVVLSVTLRNIKAAACTRARTMQEVVRLSKNIKHIAEYETKYQKMNEQGYRG